MFSDSDGPRVSLIMNTNLGHNWPAGQGGNAGNFISKKSINYPAYLARFFFENNRRSRHVKMPELLVNGVESASSKFIVSGTATIPHPLIKTISVSVLKKENNNDEMDRFDVAVKPNGEFEGTTKNLPVGEYTFRFSLVQTSGLVKNFFRPGWLGDIPGVMGPQVVNVNMESAGDCFIVKGQAVPNGGEKLREVIVELDQKRVGSAEVEQTTYWSFNQCGLAEGPHVLSLYAVNDAGLKSAAQNFRFEINANAATATLQSHMESHRLRWEDYGTWYAKYGNRTFTLYKQADGSWSDLRTSF